MRSMHNRSGPTALAGIAAMTVLLAGCGGGQSATSVRARQQPAGEVIPATTSPPDEESRSTTPSTPSEDTLDTTSPTLPELPREAPTPPTPDVEPLDAQLANDNVRDGGLGSLCWARWEVNRQIRIGVSNVKMPESREAADGAVETMRSDLLPSLNAELGQVLTEVPELQQFVARFAADVAAAQKLVQDTPTTQAAVDGLARQFDFDAYPQVEEYRKLASEHPSCLHL